MLKITLSERIKLELRHRDPVEITELILDNSKATDIEGLSCDYKNLSQLSLVNVGLISLKNFPSLPNLEKLDLSDNRISSGLEYLKSCLKLNQLFLTNNKLRNLNDIKALSQLPCLETLDLSNCELSEIENYRQKVFEMIPSLKCLDGYLEFEESCDYESESEYYEDDCYYNFYESAEDDENEGEDEECDDDYEDQEHNSSGKQINGKRGKSKSKAKFVSQDDQYHEELIETGDLYYEVYPRDSTNPELFEVTDDNYLDGNYDEVDNHRQISDYETSDEDDHYITPPSHGSKFAPVKPQDSHKSIKRPYCYNDDYEISAKVYIQDNDSYSPFVESLD